MPSLIAVDEPGDKERVNFLRGLQEFIVPLFSAVLFVATGPKKDIYVGLGE